jgi:membrane peptidoglycan carboxypeptidase
VYRESRTFTKVYDRDGNIVIDNTQDSREILSEKAVNYMNYCLQYAVSNGTGGEAAIYGQTVYGKTGTTSNNKDRWFCGYTGYYAAAVWVGYDQPEVINGITGNPAAKLFNKVLSQVHQGLPKVSLVDTSNMVYVTVCLDSGRLATDACKLDVRGFDETPTARTEQLLVYREDIPRGTCDKHVIVDYCCEGEAVANEYCLKFAEVEDEDLVTKIEERALVKMTDKEMEEILKAKKYGLQEPFWSDHIFYYIGNDGSPKDFYGLSGTVNSNAEAPYLVCTMHTQKAWEAYEESQKTEETEPEEGEKNEEGGAA